MNVKGGDKLMKTMKSSKRLARWVTLACAAWATTAMAASDDEIKAAVRNGLAYLQTTQVPGDPGPPPTGGYWNYYLYDGPSYEQAATGAAVSAFLTHKDEWGTKAAAYQTVVDNAIGYLLSTATITTVGARDDGYNPCGTGTCTGVYWDGGGEPTYSRGIGGSSDCYLRCRPCQ